MEDFSTPKNIALITFVTAYSYTTSALFTLSIFSLISDFRYVPQYYSMTRNMALLLTAFYVCSLIKFMYNCIESVNYLISLPEDQKFNIETSAISVWVKTYKNKALLPEEELFSGIVGCSIACIPLGLLNIALPVITAFALPSILSLDRNLIIASLSVISAVVVFASAVSSYCALKLIMLKEASDKLPLPDVRSPTNPLNEPVESDKLLDNAYLVGTEASQSIGSGKIAATFT